MQEARETMGASIRHGGGWSILVADDSEPVRALVATFLSRRGHRVHPACDGVEAWRCFQDVRPQLVITDLEMPGADGWDLLWQIRTVSPTTPVVLMTGRTEDDLSLTAARAGAAAVLAKPFFLQDLARVVERCRTWGPTPPASGCCAPGRLPP